MENYRCEKCGNETVSILGVPPCHNCGHPMKKIEPLSGKTESGANVPLDRLVIRQLLEGEIKSLDRSIERHTKAAAMSAAANDDARRGGILWALFVLNQELGV